MKYLDPALEIIKRFEGLRLDAYLCPAKVWTIGYGTTKYPDGSPVKAGDKIDLQRAEEYLLHDLGFFVGQVRKMVLVPLTTNQFCALVSFCYNLGPGALKSSTLLRKLNARAPKEEVAAEFLKWVKAGGKTLKGLVARRQAEQELFLKEGEPYEPA